MRGWTRLQHNRPIRPLLKPGRPMSPNGHFLTVQIGTLALSAAATAGVYLARHWLEEHGVPSFALMLVTFVFVFVSARWLVRSLTPVRCPHGCGCTAYELDGHHGRFRCRVCGREL